MKKLVVYFSQTGNTKKVADIIAKEEKADLEQIKEAKKRYTGFGWILFSGVSGMLKRKSEIKQVEHSPDEYDLIYVGTPVWGWNLVPAVRSYLSENKIKGKKIALFCTMGSSGEDKTFKSMKELIEGCEIVGELAVKDKEAKEGAEEKVKEWLAGIKK